MSKDLEDLEHRLRDLAGLAEGVSLPSGQALRAAAGRRRARRRRVAVVVTSAVVVAGAVSAAALAASGPTAITPASRTGGGTGVTTTVAGAPSILPEPLARATATLQRYVAAEATAATAAYRANRSTTRSLATAPTFAAANQALSVHSAPVDDQGTLVAVAAFAYSSTGRPVQVLAYAAGTWSVVTSLPAHFGSPVQPAGNDHLLALTDGPVAVADVTGDGRPDFLVLSTGATSTPGFVVSQDGRHGDDGGWRFVPNSGPYPTSDVVGGSPQFRGGSLVSTYDDCVPDCASGQQATITWTYEVSTGDFWAPDPPGDTRANAGPATGGTATTG